MDDQLELFSLPPNRPQTDWEVDSRGHDPSWDEIVRVQDTRQTTENRTLTCGKLDDAIRLAHGLSDKDLELLGDAVSSMLQARGLVRVQKRAEMPEMRTLTNPEPNKKATPKGSYEEKFVRKHGKAYGPYLYLRWWSGGKHKSTYLGKAPP